MENAKEIKFAPIHEMATIFEAWCKENGFVIEERERACGGSMYYEVRHVSGISFAQSIRISNHPHKYNAPDYSVGDDSFEGVFSYLTDYISERAMRSLSIQVSCLFSQITA